MPPVVAELKGTVRGRRVQNVGISLKKKPRDRQTALAEAASEFDRFFAKLASERDVKQDIANVARGVDAEFRAMLREDRTVELHSKVEGRRSRETHRYVVALLARQFKRGVEHQTRHVGSGHA